MTVREIADPAERSRLCAAILRSLPEWFGIESAVEAYVRETAELPTLAVGEDGFLSLRRHTPRAAEIHVMGVRPERHRAGVGTALVEAAERLLAADGVAYLQVKTLGPSRPDPNYEATRRFYEARGFVALEELHGLWDEGNPTLLLVKHLPCR